MVSFEARCGSGFPNFVLHYYLTIIYRSGSAALLIVVRIVEAEYVALSLGGLLRAVEYGPVSHFAQD